jgi:signal transduction histidine kinase
MKLLQKTIRGYLLYSMFTLVVAIPVFYFTIQNVLRHQADEELLSTKESLKASLEAQFTKAGLHEIKFPDSGVWIVPAANEFKDSLFTVNEYDSAEKEMIPYRVIRWNIHLNGHPYLLTRKISLLENDDLIKTILNVQVTLLILLLAGLIIINWRLSIRIWKPFYRTLEKLKKFNIEKDSRLGLTKSGVNEFDDLNHSLEGFAERTHQAFVSQKEFAENASHELQTPLAIMQGKLELLMQTPGLTEEQATLIDELADAGRRMSHLNKNLILLTKIENNQFHELEKISLRSVTKNFADTLYLPAIEQKLIELNTDLQ